MTRLLIENSRIYAEGRFLSDHTLIIAAGLIAGIAPSATVALLPADRRINAHGACALPGFVDVHVHGSANCDVMDASAASLRGLSAFLLRQGVTSFLGTTMADTAERIEAAISAMRAHAEKTHSPLLGIHIEGPYLNPAFRGSQPVTHLRTPQPEEYLPWLDGGPVKLMTLAPELEASAALIDAAASREVTLSIGHSGASYEAAKRYFAAGARHITHTFNGMAGIHHRQPGIFVAAAEHPAVNFEIIPDGIHVHPAVIRLLVRLVGSERVVAITDAMRAAGLSDGAYGMGDVAVVVKDGVARDSAGSLAGSTLTMPAALRNLMRFCDLTLTEALPMVTRVPARAIGMYPQKGSLQHGTDADIVIWDERLGVLATLIGGELAYTSDSFSS